ncbi:MAG: tetratricopeptide repeat protein [Sulfurimicrobium sp.]|nr:tetratricopeptide repeat protein [Sulfurimicrobium sp.]
MIPSRLTHLLAFVPFLLALGATAAHAGTEEDFDRGAAAHRMQDYKTAYKIWLALAEKGQVDAQYNIARMIQDGDGTAQNPAEAAKWFQKAAKQGDREARHYLGLMYLRGEGVAASETEADRLFALNRQQHHLHHNHELAEKWQRQLAQMNRDSRKQ